jgi:hypothetical protein
MVERSRHVAIRVAERHPQLHAVQTPCVFARRLLGVRDAAARRHHVDPTGAQYRFLAKTVVVDDLAIEQPRDGLQSDVRVRRDVHRLSVGERERTKSIEKTPRADETLVLHRQRARDRQRAETQFAIGVGHQLVARGPECHARFGGYRFSTPGHPEQVH